MLVTADLTKLSQDYVVRARHGFVDSSSVWHTFTTNATARAHAYNIRNLPVLKLGFDCFLDKFQYVAVCSACVCVRA